MLARAHTWLLQFQQKDPKTKIHLQSNGGWGGECIGTWPSKYHFSLFDRRLSQWNRSWFRNLICRNGRRLLYVMANLWIFPHLVTLQRIGPLRHIEVATVTSVLSLTTCAPKVAAIRSCVRALALSTDELTWRKVGNVPPDAITWLPAAIGLVQNYKAIFWEVGSVLWHASFLRSTHKPSHIFAF